ncbi:EamA family transporter [Desulfurobacterium atlanticum]|uniref:Transporter family protein n=1 Tax=Desulfurobacterium atlanticum TaxID=240169 RepID=A0A239AAB2_9BACT|nr:EamA family transporter [Desulfurobacterium atlanticum]SNR92596.1 transporter family protein [Desulfurobacterium atlanticum]
MDKWLFFSILALLFWGLWGFFPKVASNYISPESILVYQTLGCLSVVILLFFLPEFEMEFNFKGILFSFLGGVAGTLGSLFFLYAVKTGKLSVVITITALYPMITIFLAVLLLKENLSLKQVVGIIFALVSIVLIAGGE